MADSENSSSATIGFVTVVEHAEHGLFGGYLVLNSAGRPLEFHCTAPVKPNRAQEILFGPALAPYLEGELIAGALLGRSKMPPAAVCTDRPAILSVRSLVDFPVLLSVADGAQIPLMLASMEVGENRIATSVIDGDAVRGHSALLAGLDLLEPFSRIRDALEEARNSAANKGMRSAA